MVIRDLLNKHPDYYRVGGGSVGGKKEKQEYIRPPGGGRSGSVKPDVTLKHKTEDKYIRVNTVNTYAGGQPEGDEMAALARIHAAFPNDLLYWVPKRGNFGGLKYTKYP